jgi:hypothetical protein
MAAMQRNGVHITCRYGCDVTVCLCYDVTPCDVHDVIENNHYLKLISLLPNSSMPRLPHA